MTTAQTGTAPPGYRYLRHLGAGGFGDVDLAEHVMTGRRVAIKYIQPHLLTDPDVLARFRREARVLAATDVPSVVRVYDLVTTSDPAYLVMDYVPGASLWDLMEVAPLPPRQAIPILRDVAGALRAMADRGLVHRDIKPSNVFVLPSGRAKLGDFGLARAVVDDGGFRTSGAPAGTPAYFPPEVSSGEDEATVESDAYSFAVMAYEVLTGTRPIDAPDAVSLITAHWTQPPRPVTEALPGFPPSAAEVLMRALAKSPAGRPLPHEQVAALETVPAEAWPTAARPDVPVPETLDSFGSAGSAAPATVPAPSAPVTVRTAAPTEPSPAAAPPPAGTPAVDRRRRYPLVAALAVLLVGALAAAWWVTADDDDPVATRPRLAVTAVSVTADPPAPRCPRAVVALQATVSTNGGAGSLTVAWTLPDGSTGPRQAFSVGAGQRRVVARVDTTLTGRNPVSGDAVAVVTPSGLRATAPVAYRCAG